MPDPNNKQRVRQAKAAATLLDPSTTHVDYIAARGHPRLGTQAIVVGGVFIAAFLIAIAMGYIIFPGFLAVLLVYYSVLPPRGVVVADQGVAVLNRSVWNSKPNRLIALLTHEQMAQVQAIAKGSKAEMAFGPERLTFSKGEWARFTAAVQRVSQNWTGNQHLHAAGGQPGAPQSIPGQPMLGQPMPGPAIIGQAVPGQLPPPPGSNPLGPLPGAAPAPNPNYTGLPPIPGVDTPHEEVGPQSKPPPHSPEAGGATAF